MGASCDAPLSALHIAFALMIVGRHIIVNLHLHAVSQQFACPIVADRVFHFDESVDVSQWQSDGVWLCCTGYHVASIHRVECSKLFDVYSQHPSNLLQMDVSRHHHCICLCRQCAVHRTDVMLRVVGHHVVGSYESRHVTSCFFWQIGINLPIVFCSSRPLYCLVDVSRSTVVSSDDEVPVAKHLIEIAQIVCSSKRSLDGVATFVNE